MSHVAESSQSSVGHFPAADRWEFDRSVTDVFDDMLRRSIPQYEVMRQAVFRTAASFVQPGTQIVDLGCSRGEALAPFVEAHGNSNTYVGVDVSEPMLEAAQTRFSAEIAHGSVRILPLDLRSAYPEGPASVTLCVLTLQFTPLDHRQRILADVFRNTQPGGALILVEKVLGSSAELSRVMVREYHRFKARNGYSEEEIERKRLALEGVLVPLTAKWNEEMLHKAGFEEIDCFWRWMNFAGWLAVKRRGLP